MLDHESNSMKELKYLILVTALVKCLFSGSISLCFVITDANMWLLRYCYESTVSWTNTFGNYWVVDMSLVIYPMCNHLWYCGLSYIFSVIDFGILCQLAAGILQKHFMLQAFSLRLLTSLVYFNLMWVSDCGINYLLHIDASFTM